jgi:fucose permease
MIIASGTIVSSLVSERLTKRFGTAKVTAISVLMTSVALFGFSFSQEFWLIMLWALPYGLGAGAVDVALNNYVAIHYAAKHMSWLHAFWGVGASISPYIMGYYLIQHQQNWSMGYQTVAMMQIALTLVLFLTLPLWAARKSKTIVANESENADHRPVPLKHLLKIPGVKPTLVAFFAYATVEQTTGLWASSFLVENKQLDVGLAATFGALFFLGITLGRFLSGFVADKWGDAKLIRNGTLLLSVGIILLGLPLANHWLALTGFVLIGIGCAPIFPAVIHATPTNFGVTYSQGIIGLQMAAAYLGTTFMPPLFGLLANYFGSHLLAFYLLFFAIGLWLMTERVNHLMRLKTNV